MATYAYTQIYEGTTGKGTIKYNVSAAASLVEPLTQVTVTGQVSGNTKALKSIGVYFQMSERTVPNGLAYYKNVSIAKNTATTFKLTFQFPLELWTQWYETRTQSDPNQWAMQPGFIVGTKTLSDSQLYDSDWAENVILYGVSGYDACWDDAGTIPDMLTLNMAHPAIDQILTMSVTDEAAVSALVKFGAMATGNSLPRVTGSWGYMYQYLARTAHAALTLTGAMTGVYEADVGSGVTTATFDLPAPTVAGTVNWTYTVTDMFGNTATASGSFTVLDYAPPYITTCSFERYRTVQTDTGWESEPSPSGEYIWLNLDANIAAVNSRNAWTATLTAWRKERPEIAPTAGSAVYENTTGERRTVSTWALAGSDGRHIELTRDEGNLSNQMVLSAAYDWSLRLTLADALGNSVTLLVDDDIRKDSAILDVGPYGVSVGARSTALEADPQFECSYPARFYGDVAVSAGGLLKKVTLTRPSSISVAANDAANADFTFNQSAIGEGWTAVGVVGYNTGQNRIFVSNYAVSGTSVTLRLRSVHTAALTVTPTVTVLCVRTSL